MKVSLKIEAIKIVFINSGVHINTGKGIWRCFKRSYIVMRRQEHIRTGGGATTIHEPK
jgi:hypothetical protein